LNHVVFTWPTNTRVTLSKTSKEMFDRAVKRVKLQHFHLPESPRAF
jgi:hypothetical protein